MSNRRVSNVEKMQKALDETLSILGEQSREAVLLYLEKHHNISIDGPASFTEEKLESAFDTLFGSGQLILMRKFTDEVKKHHDVDMRISSPRKGASDRVSTSPAL